MVGTTRVHASRLDQTEDRGCLEYEEMKAYVDEELTAEHRLAVQEHADQCRVCRDEVADLLLLKSSIAESGPSAPLERIQRHSPGSGSDRAVLKITRPLLDTPLWKRSAIWAGAGAALAGALLALAWFLVIAPMRRQIRSLGSRVSDLRASSESLRKESDERVAELKDQISKLELENTASAVVDQAQNQAQTVVLNDGGRLIRLVDGGLEGITDPYFASVVQRALESSRVPRTNLKVLSSKPETLMGVQSGNPNNSRMSPIATVVEDDRPLFSWSPIPGAASYEVLITDERSGRLFKSGPLDKASWKPDQPLNRGRVYSWAVKVTLENGREVYLPAPAAPRAKFEVLDARQEEELRRARSLNPPSHLLLALLSAKAGLTNEARQQLKTLASSNPRSLVVRKLEASLDRGTQGP